MLRYPRHLPPTRANSPSQDGGLFCDLSGTISKPFPNKPYCVTGTNTIGAQNMLSDTVAFCQTVLPGNEAMLIPTSVGAGEWNQLAVPGMSYWCSTAAQYVSPVDVECTTNLRPATTSTHPESTWMMPVSGVMDQSPLETGPRMLRVLTRTKTATPLPRSRGTPSGLDVIFPALPQPLVSRSSAEARTAMEPPARSIRLSTVSVA